MPVNNNDIVRVTAKMDFGGAEDIINVMHCENITGAPVADGLFMTDVAAWLDAAYTLINGQITSVVNYITVRGQNITQSILLPDTPWPTLVFGGAIGDALPLPTTAMVFFPTQVPRRQGKIYCPLFTESDNLFGTISVPALANLALFATAIRTAFTGVSATLRYVVWSRKFLGFSVPVSQQVPGIYRTQRRRRQGVGS